MTERHYFSWTQIGLVLAFIAGAAVSGAMNPRPTPHMLAPSYGPCFLVGSLCMVAAAAMAEAQPGGRGLYYFAAAACGVQNGMTSMYSGNLIRTTHLTGTSTGQWARARIGLRLIPLLLMSTFLHTEQTLVSSSGKCCAGTGKTSGSSR